MGNGNNDDNENDDKDQHNYLWDALCKLAVKK